jgi:hypothetical protein
MSRTLVRLEICHSHYGKGLSVLKKDTLRSGTDGSFGRWIDRGKFHSLLQIVDRSLNIPAILLLIDLKVIRGSP